MRRISPLGQLAQLQTKGDVFEDRHMRPQRIVLKDEADLAGIRRHEHAALDGGLHLIGDGNRSRVGNFEPGDGSQQRRLAATRRPEKRKNALVELKADVVEGLEVFEELGNAFDFEN